jgi:7-keto-8-aminopelargonate synthetase-like enzyme
LDALERLLGQCTAIKLIVTDAVFSVDGDWPTCQLCWPN